MSKPTENGRFAHLRPWIEMTANERRVVCLILALAVLGACVRYWHRRRAADAPPVPGKENVQRHWR